MKIGVVVINRNDGYKDFERGLIHFKSMLDTFDEVTYIDWNSPERSFLWEIKDQLPETGKLKHFIIPPEIVSQIILDPKAQQCNENFSLWGDLKGIWGKYNNLFKGKPSSASRPPPPPPPPPRFLLKQQRQPMISIVNNKMQITSGTTNNYNNTKTWNFPSFNNFNGLSHIIYNFKETSIDTYLNGELLQTL